MTNMNIIEIKSEIKNVASSGSRMNSEWEMQNVGNLIEWMHKVSSKRSSVNIFKILFVFVFVVYLSHLFSTLFMYPGAVWRRVFQ